MTLLYFDGFGVGDHDLRWVTFGNAVTRAAPTISTDTPFGRGRSLLFPQDFDTIEAGVGANPSMRMFRGFTPSAEVFFGVNFKYHVGAHPFSDFYSIAHFYTDAGAREHVYLNLRNNGTLEVWRADGYTGAPGDTLLATSSAALLIPDVFFFLEVHVTIAASGGVVEVRRNGQTIISFTGQTEVAYGGSDDLIAMLSLNATRQNFNANWMPEAYYTDLYVCNGLDDGVGPANNTFLGEGRAQTLLPNAAGTDTDFTPVGSGNNYDNVNDVPYSVSDYNTSAVVGDRDTYQLDDLDPTTAEVLAVQAIIIAQGTDAAVKIKTALRAGGTLYYDPAVTLDGVPSVVSLVLREQDPATSAAWTVPNVNALELGVEITT